MGDRDHTVLRNDDGGEAFGVRELSKSELRRLLDDPDALLWKHLDHPVKIDYGSLIVRAELPLDAAPIPVAYKRYCPRNWWKAFCALFRQSRARSAWRLARELEDRGINTARPLVMCEPRQTRFFRTSVLATEWIEAAENLHLYGWRLADRPSRQRLRCAARCAESLGRLIGRMHALQIAHRDLKGANLLVKCQIGPDGTDRISTYLIDVDGVCIGKRLSPARRAANLARLAVVLEAHRWVTRSICCRFLRAYASQFPSDTIAWKPLWQDVAVRTRRIIRHQRRRGEEVL